MTCNLRHTNPSLSRILSTAADEIAAHGLRGESATPEELLELARLLQRWAVQAAQLELMAGASAASIAQAELAAIETGARRVS